MLPYPKSVTSSTQGQEGFNLIQMLANASTDSWSLWAELNRPF